QIRALRLTFFIDDGFVAWSNGKELYRENVTDPLGTNTLAANQPIDPAPLTNQMVLFDNLYEGSNIIAVQVFNTSLAGSSDIGFDLQLETVTDETNAPTVFSVGPAPGSQVVVLTNINVIFSENVIGVDATDLLIGGVPATSVTGGGSGYTFYFSQPPAG